MNCTLIRILHEFIVYFFIKYRTYEKILPNKEQTYTMLTFIVGLNSCMDIGYAVCLPYLAAFWQSMICADRWAADQRHLNKLYAQLIKDVAWVCPVAALCLCLCVAHQRKNQFMCHVNANKIQWFFICLDVKKKGTEVE